MHQNATKRENGTTLVSEHHGLTVVSTTSRGGSHGQPLVAAMAVATWFLPGCFGFLCGLARFPSRVFDF